MKKYILHPGYATSISDGDRHFITATMLARLYRVNIRECIVEPYEGLSCLLGMDTSGMRHLYPRTDWRY